MTECLYCVIVSLNDWVFVLCDWIIEWLSVCTVWLNHWMTECLYCVIESLNEYFYCVTESLNECLYCVTESLNEYFYCVTESLIMKLYIYIHPPAHCLSGERLRLTWDMTPEIYAINNMNIINNVINYSQKFNIKMLIIMTHLFQLEDVWEPPDWTVLSWCGDNNEDWTVLIPICGCWWWW